MKNSGGTHNTFLLSGTDLQNFTVYLEQRFHELVDGVYITKTQPFKMDNGHYFSVQFSVLET